MVVLEDSCKLNIKYFKNILKDETIALQSTSKKWIQERENVDLAEEVIGDIDVATGQADLLIKERFTQFQSLIDDCKLKRGEKEVTLHDLEGFWHIIYIQVQQILVKFSKLEELKGRNWVQKSESLPINQKLPLQKKPLTAKNNLIIRKIPVQPKTNIREHILAARRKMQLKKNLDLPNAADTSPKDECKTPCKENGNNTVNICISVDEETKHFDAGFFNVRTPVKSSSGAAVRKETSNSATPKLLSSTVLKKQLEVSPIQHKDYFPCIRITRSMKKNNFKI